MKSIDEGEIRRDRWGRPVFEGQSWTRPSTLAKALDDNSALIKWSSRMTALGMSRSADLTALASTHTAEDRDALNKIVDQALTRAQSDSGANMGTAVHQATFDHDLGQDITHLPEMLRKKVNAYQELIDTHRLKPLAGEVFVVSDEFQCAGTLDRIYEGPRISLVGDIKTSRSSAATYSAVSWAIQVAVYASGVPVVNGERKSWEELGLPVPSDGTGVIIHLPSDDEAGDTAWVVDLGLGKRLASLALDVRAARKTSPLVRS